MRVRLAAVAVIGLALAAVGALALVRGDDASAEERPELQRLLDPLVSGVGRAAPGATAYVSGPRGAWSGAAGVANVRTGEPMRPDARMRLESVSKLWTATVVLRLVADGRLGLDNTVESVLPGLLPDGRRIMVRQLLDHTSGLVDNNDFSRDPRGYLARVQDPALKAELVAAATEFEASPEYEFPAALTIRFAAALPLLAAPGTAYHYSNIGYMVAGRIAERVAGAPLAELVDREIVRPLALETAAYDPRSRISGPHARGYALGVGGALTDRTAEVADLDANGGVVSSAADEGRFLTALMSRQLLGPAELAALKTPSPHSPYGLGTGVADSGCAGMAYVHGGAGAAFTTSVIVSGDGARVAVLLLNGRAPDGYGDELARDVVRRLFCAA